ncbi:MAG: DUF2520 domain-containing protein [Paraprevotella sp.]|nr:DUF2520 domain-containing protein [Paraprevotella sp.]
MKVVWIGAGNLATQMGLALKEAGHETCQVFSRTMASAGALAERLECPATDDIDAVMSGADVYIFSVKDSVLEELTVRIAPRTGHALCLHTGGSMPLDVFRGHASCYGVLYPMQTFSRTCPVDFREIPCFIEAGSEEAREQTERLAQSVSGRVMYMDSERRRYLHLAAVFACNFVNHCYALSAELLKEQDIPFDVMWPLIDETARKIHRLPPSEAQTGPAVRYDRNVIDRQCALLDGHPAVRHIYEMMSRSIHELAGNRETENNREI